MAASGDSFAATCWLERRKTFIIDDNNSDYGELVQKSFASQSSTNIARIQSIGLGHSHLDRHHGRRRLLSQLIANNNNNNNNSIKSNSNNNNKHRTLLTILISLAIALTLSQVCQQHQQVQATPTSSSSATTLFASTSATTTTTTSAAIQADQFIQQAFPHNSLSLSGANFDASQFKSVYEAIRAHPDLHEFANLCEAKGVKEIAAMDKTTLTIFAPIDKSLADLLAKAKSRSINLAELAKHHIAPGLVMPDDNTKYPFQFNSYAPFSPLYLNSIQLATGSKSSSRHQPQPQQQLFVNNAKILATYLIQIDSDNQFQTLHIIDQPLDFAYVTRRTQLRGQQALPAAPATVLSAHLASSGTGNLSPQSAPMTSAIGGANSRFTTVKRALNLDDLLSGSGSAAASGNGDNLAEQAAGGVYDFYERFGDLLANQAQVDIYHARALRNQAANQQQQQQQPWARSNLISVRDQALAYDHVKLARMFNEDASFKRQLRGKLYNLTESNSLNTYFLPINSEELDALLDAAAAAALPVTGSGDAIDSTASVPRQLALLALQAHVIPDQVLFTRTMQLGQLHSTLFNQLNGLGAGQSVALSLVKTLPPVESLFASSISTNDNSTTTLGQDQELAQATIGRKLLATPLLLQAKCEPSVNQHNNNRAAAAGQFRNGITNAEILVANIPIANGVLHLIKRPLLVQSNNLLDYINDNEHQLTNIVQALGSQTGATSYINQLMASGAAAGGAGANGNSKPQLELNRFRELLTRGDRQLLSTFSNEFLHSNRTILAPTDEAFSRLRYDLRALISGDETLIPAHWDPSYRQDLLERLLKRHIIPDQTLTASGGTIEPLNADSSSSSASGLNLNGQLVTLKRLIGVADSEANELESSAYDANFQVECDATLANLIHRDLIGTNGVLHLIDRVLGEDQETIHSLLESIVLRFQAKYAKVASGSTDQSSSSTTTATNASPINELSQLIEASLRQSQALASQSSVDQSIDGQQQQHQHQLATSDHQPIDLEQRQEQQQQKRHAPELQIISKTIESYLSELSPIKRNLLASSVNISYSLAKLVSRAESRDDWNEKFKLQDKSFTYFIPNDLAWFRLQQAQPELYKPLMFFLEQQQQQQSNSNNNNNNGIALEGGNQLGGQFDNGGPQADVAALAAAASGATIGGGGGGGEQAALTASNRPRASESSHRLLQVLERHLIGNKKLAAKELDQLASVQTIGATLRLVNNQNNQQQQQHYHLAQSNQQQLSENPANDGQPMSAFAALHSIIGGGGSHSSSSSSSSSAAASTDYQQAISMANQIKRALKFSSVQANIVQAHETSNGFVYLIDNVLISPEDSEYIVQTSSTPAISSTMSSLLGAHNSAILDFVQGLLSTSTTALNANLMLSLIGTLALAIIVLALVAIGLTVRRRRQSKLNRHQQLESGLTSSSSDNSGSTSTTKSL